MESNELILKLDKDTTIPLIEGLGKSAYAIAVAHGFRGTEQEWLDSLKGLQGPQGEPGLKGDPFTYADFTPEQLEDLKGPKGDKGEDGRDGASATADNAKALLLNGNVWCESASVDDVLTALIGNLGKPFPRTEFKALTVPSVIQDQQVVSVTGEPHYSVKVVGNDTPFVLDSTGFCNVNIPPLGEDDIKLTYHNFVGAKVAEYKINGVQIGAPADDTIAVNGSVYKLYGDTIKINVTQNTTSTDDGYKFEFIPQAWRSRHISSIQIKSNSAVNLYTGRSSKMWSVAIQPNNIPIYVENPQLITFCSNDIGVYPTLNIGTLQWGTSQITYNTVELKWDNTEHRYVAMGAVALDHL